MTILLAITLLPATALQPAFADEPVERPAITGGDTALEGYSAEASPVAVQREDGMLIADGLVYTVADGGLSLVSFDGLPEGEDALKEIVVPEAVSVDGKDTAVMAVAIAEGNVAESVVSLTLPQSINGVDTATLATAFPGLASIEVAAPKASAPVAAGAAAMKAAYSSFGGILYKNNLVASESDASQTTLTKELVWAPPATVVARIPVECTSIAAGAFADVKDLKTVVCFGVMGEIPQAKKTEDGTVIPGAFTDEQIQTVNIIVPQTGTVVTDDDRVSADVAVTDHSTMDIKREAWWKSGFASDRITLGEVYGSTTNTLPVTEEGVLETAESEVAYAPETTQNSSSRKAGIEPPESAIPTPVPDDDELDSSESGLVFTHLADMTLSVRWKGDPTATPSHIDIPAYATINGVVYPVTEIAPNAFKDAIFLQSVTIPEGVINIGETAFAGCINLKESYLPSALVSAGQVDLGISDSGGEDGSSDEVPIGPAHLPGIDEDTLDENTMVPYAASTGIEKLSIYGLYNEMNNKFTVDTIAGDDGTLTLRPDDTISARATYRFNKKVHDLYTESGRASFGNVIRLHATYMDGSHDVHLLIEPISGWQIVGVYFGMRGGMQPGFGSSTEACLYVSTVRDEAVGSSELLSEATADGKYAAKDHGHSGYAPSIHNHTMANITDLKKYGKSDNVAWADVSGKPTFGTLASKNSVAWSEVTGKPASFTPSAHNHTMANITDLKKYGKSDNVAWADVSGKPSTFTPSAHTHDDRYYTEGETDGKLDAKAAWGQLSKEQGTYQDADGKRVEDAIKRVSDALDSAKEELQGDIDEMAKEIEGGFGTIRYEGLDGDSDAGVYPTSYKAGGTPSLHAPSREGYDFAGWTWKRGDASGTSENLAEAFAAAGEVVLTATWAQEAPKGTYFFTERDPLLKGSPAPQEHVIKVVLTRTRSYPVDRVEFSWDNWTGLVAEGASVTLTVGTEYDEETGEIRNGRSCTLARDAAATNRAAIEGLGMYPVQFASRQCGLYVGISVPDGAVDRVVESYTEGSYVDSLVKMSYKLAG